jgi:hypothetical protein
LLDKGINLFIQAFGVCVYGSKVFEDFSVHRFLNQAEFTRRPVAQSWLNAQKTAREIVQKPGCVGFNDKSYEVIAQFLNFN